MSLSLSTSADLPGLCCVRGDHLEPPSLSEVEYESFVEVSKLDKPAPLTIRVLLVRVSNGQVFVKDQIKQNKILRR